jgi:hypothetical protein
MFRRSENHTSSTPVGTFSADFFNDVIPQSHCTRCMTLRRKVETTPTPQKYEQEFKHQQRENDEVV